jgi:hypothetical protein
MKDRRVKEEDPPPSQSPFEFDGSEGFATRDSLDNRSVPINGHLVTNGNHNLSDKDSTGLRYLTSVVTECLDLHETCTGFYVDSSERYIVRCCCSCHTGRASGSNLARDSHLNQIATSDEEVKEGTSP